MLIVLGGIAAACIAVQLLLSTFVLQADDSLNMDWEGSESDAEQARQSCQGGKGAPTSKTNGRGTTPKQNGTPTIKHRGWGGDNWRGQ